MAQSILAGMTDYENQSIDDIAQDIEEWIMRGEKTKKKIEDQVVLLKATSYYRQISSDYKSMVHDMPGMCQTNINDMKIVLSAIKDGSLSKKHVEFLRKIGNRAVKNGDENKAYYELNDEGYWHDYNNPDFILVEGIFVEFASYCATLWDIPGMAKRLLDYVDMSKEVTNVKYEDNSIHIGDNNKITNSNFGSRVKGVKEEEKLSSKVTWHIIVPIIVTVVAAVICLWLGLD